MKQRRMSLRTLGNTWIWGRAAVMLLFIPQKPQHDLSLTPPLTLSNPGPLSLFKFTAERSRFRPGDRAETVPLLLRTELKEKHDTHDRRSRRSDTPPPPLSSEEGGEEETGEKLNGYPRTPGCVRTGGEGGGVTREERADELKRTQWKVGGKLMFRRGFSCGVGATRRQGKTRRVHAESSGRGSASTSRACPTARSVRSRQTRRVLRLEDAKRRRQLSCDSENKKREIVVLKVYLTVWETFSFSLHFSSFSFPRWRRRCFTAAVSGEELNLDGKKCRNNVC